MNGFTWAWLVWLAYFAVVELVAVVRSTRAKRAGRPATLDTLSEHVWLWFGTAKAVRPDTWAYLRRLVLVAFVAWLAVHFVGGGQLV